MPQLRQTTLTYMETPLALRQKPSTPRRPGTSETSLSTPRRTSRSLTSPTQHQENMVITVQDDSSDEADDEDDEPQKPGKSILSSCTEPNSQGVLDAPQMKPKSTTQRVLSRYWFDHVSISPERPERKDAHNSLATVSRPTASLKMVEEIDDHDEMPRGPRARRNRPPLRTSVAKQQQSKQTRLSRSGAEKLQADPIAIDVNNEGSASDFSKDGQNDESMSDSQNDKSMSDSQTVDSGISAGSRSTKRKRGRKSTSERKPLKLAKTTNVPPKGPTSQTQPKARNQDSFTYKLGVDLSLPPLHKIEDIFDDLTANAVRQGFPAVLDHLKGRKLKVATMCSGTESPMLALGLISDSLSNSFGRSLQVEHLFSAEIVPFKQAYIERNFSPPIIFRDIRELITGNIATTAYGAAVSVPGDVDLLVAGFSCVDFSTLNVNRQSLQDTGESGDTFRAIFQYAKKWRPSLIVLENVYGAPWKDLKAHFAEAEYGAEFVKLDTKQYYIPHTRQRGYMVCMDQRKLKGAQTKAEQWAVRMAKFRRPASSSIEAFMLDEDDPRVHRGREELARGAIGDEKGPREVDWTKCQGRHQDYRADLFLGSKRPMTAWEDNGSCKMPDYAWSDWGVKQVERIWDTLEISLLRNARRGFDSQYKTRVWELSQNIDRFTDTTPFGITGCITPTGQPYVTNRGGPLIGLEGLSMQGLPIEKLLLTRETQKNLQDLAGNAMTSTVVGAAIAAALIVGYQALKRGDGVSMVVDDNADQSSQMHGEENLIQRELNLNDFVQTPVKLMLLEARRSLRLCVCEGRLALTSRTLQRCKLCGYTSCAKCGGNPQHQYELLTNEEVDLRITPAAFQNSLKNALPMRLSLIGLTDSVLSEIHDNHSKAIVKSDWTKLMQGIFLALGAELRFCYLKRAEVWTAVYESPCSRLELILNSVQVEWRLFAKPARTEAGNSRLRELLKRPFARMRPTGNGLLDGKWQLCLPVTNHFQATIEGVGQLVRSWESRLGLQEHQYAEKNVWSKLRVTIRPEAVEFLDEDISGTYNFLPDCGTASGSLHKREDQHLQQLFLFLDPSRLGNPDDDVFVFANDIRRLNHEDTRQIVAEVNSSWRPLDTKGPQRVQFRAAGQWVDCRQAALQPVIDPTKLASFATPPVPLQIDLASESCSEANAILSCIVPLKSEENVGWKKGPWTTLDKVNERTFFQSFAWLTERIRIIQGLDSWHNLDSCNNEGNCQQCAPHPPAVRWKMLSNKMTPFEDPQQACPYERALKNRPAPFVTQARIDESNMGRLRIGVNIASLVHKAMATLQHQGGGVATTMSWRLITDYVAPSRVMPPKFVLRSNKADVESGQPPNFRCRLRKEQRRSLTWMQSQESDDAPDFVEEEVEEAQLPHLGWRAEAKASRCTPIRGGVLADEVGYGKTAITLGLIDMQSKSQIRSKPAPRPGKISVKATVIVVPTQLVQQWRNEIDKFLGKKYQVLVIKTVGDLNRLTVKSFEAADIIIVTWGVFNNEKYLAALAQFAALPELPAATSGRAFDAWFDYSSQRLNDHVELIQTASEKMHSYLKDKLREIENDENLIHHVPSKRLKGAQYRAAQAEKSGKPAKKKAKLAHPPDELDDNPKSKPRAGGGLNSDPFRLGSTSVKRDWSCMKFPLFQMFHFKRLVVDEFTYIDGKNHTSITRLSADCRWVLSGTPPLGDFADVKTISVFLGINLGVDDDASNVLKMHHVKLIQKYRTAVENFRALGQSHSPAWHQHRHEVAERFLEQFVRQNVAEIEEIPFKEHLRPVILPAAERAIYMELNQHLMAQDMRIRKGRARVDNDRERRLNQALGDSKSPEEALIKRCSHFTLEDLTEERENAVQACDLVVKEREEQYADLLQDLQKSLKNASRLKLKSGSRNGHYDWWIDNVSNNAFGDLAATAILKEMIETATQKYGRKHAGASLPSVLSTRTPKSSAAKRSNGKCQSADDGDFELSAEEDSSSEPEAGTSEEQTRDLRELTTHLRRLSTELVSRKRSLRFFNVVRQLQLARSKFNTSAEGQTCSRCKKADLPPELLSVLTICGHTACDECLGDAQRSDECIVVGCKAAARSFNVVRATELGEEDREARVGRHYGRKLETIIDLIKNEIPKTDQVILFVQFSDLMQKISAALTDHRISHWALLSSQRHRSAKMMSDFQNNTTTTKKKVLILNVSDESASGANLTNANHLIFVSPLFVPTQYRYESSMTQAIGRARRYGQQKTVHIYQFLSLNTIDVDIIEERTGKRLVNENGGYRLRKITDPERATLPPLGGGAVRSQYYEDSD